MSQKVYIGYRLGPDTACPCVVIVRCGKRSRPLNPRLDIRNHSPAGFNWSYGGSGPAQLALALVADCCGQRLATPPIYQRVKNAIVASLPFDGWSLTADQIIAAVAAARQEAGI